MSCLGIYLPTPALPLCCCDSHDGKWQVMRLRKYHDATNETGEETDASVYTSLVDLETGDVYMYDPQAVVWFKCALLATFSVFYFGATACLRAAILITHIAQATLFRACCDNPPSCGQIFEDLKNLGATPLYWLAFEVAAIFTVVSPLTLGVFNPWDGKKVVASIERAFHGGLSYQDVPCRRTRNGGVVTRPLSQSAAFLAPCMQTRGNIYDALRNGNYAYREVLRRRA